MAEHLLTVAGDEEEDTLVWGITCTTPDKCIGWWECDECHEHKGHQAGSVDECTCKYDTGTDCTCDDSAAGCQCEFAGYDEFEFHGKRHIDGNGRWALPYEGCVVAGADLDVYADIPMRAGVWVVEDIWEDEWCFIKPIREVTNEEAGQ